MRIILIGASGQLGSDLLKNNPGHDIISLTRAELDLTRHEEAASSLAKLDADLLINTAAFHNLPQCEEDPRTALEINCNAVRSLASICHAKQMKLMTFSTDYVFDGEKGAPYRETDCVGPIQMYGISKLAGEYAARSVAPDKTYVIRSCGLFGLSGVKSKGGGNFIANRLADGLKGAPIEVSCEQFLSPTSTHDLSKAIYQLIAMQDAEPGIYHLVNSGVCSWYELTKAAFEFAGIATEVIPVNRGGQWGPVRRPLFTALSNEYARSMGIDLPSWQDAVERYVQLKTS